jgi:hypothetical protein
MNSATVILLVSGIVSLLLSGFMMYWMIPRDGQPAPAWKKTDWGETAMALGQFVLMVAGVALLAKAIL